MNTVKPSIKIVYHHRTRGDGAEGVHIRELGNAFVELGHRVVYCCPPVARRAPGLLLGMTGMSTNKMSGPSGWARLRLRQAAELLYNFISFFRLSVAILRHRPQVIYERYSCYHFGGILAAQIWRVPLCLEVNSTYAGRFDRRVLAFPRAASWIEGYVLRRAFVVAVVSSPLRDCVADRIPPEDLDKIVVTPNAINESEARLAFDSSCRDTQRRALGFDDAIVVGFVGSLRRWHGVDMLIRQIPRILEAVPLAKFLIVGSGELEQELDTLRSNPDINSRVVTTGGVPHSDVLPLISAMDVGLMPHSNTWGSPMKILEYMSMEKATIAPRLPPIEEIVKNCETGLLFEPGNEDEFRQTIETVCLNSELRRRVGKKAREFVLNERRWTDNAAQVLNAIHQKQKWLSTILVFFSLATCGCSEAVTNPDAIASRRNGETNIEVLQAAGRDIPSHSEWWVDGPSPEELIDALLPPAESNTHICIKRLYLPREIDPKSNFDESLVEGLERESRGPHYHALLAHYYDWKGNSTKSKDLMAKARDEFLQEKWTGRVHMSFRTSYQLSALFGLDWIRWADADEFEQAFLQCKQLIDDSKTKGGFRKSGYWVNDCNIEHSDMVATLLAICVCNVNPGGASDTWSREHLSRLGNATIAPGSIYSPFEFANVMSLASRDGGGREFGQKRIHPGFGGYESYFACSAVIQFQAVDTATSNRWNLVAKSRYLQTRSRGLEFERDRTVARTGLDPVAVALIQIMAKLCNDNHLAGLYQWSIADSKPSTKLLELQCLSGPKPQTVTPANLPTTRLVGSRWHYRENPAEPDSTFRVWIVNRDIENFRVAPDERCLTFCTGSVGLVDGHANRTYVVGALANGVHIARLNNNGEPHVADENYWPSLASFHPYWSRRAIDATSVLHDPMYLLGSNSPQSNRNSWTWSRDYSNYMTRDPESGLAGKVQYAHSAYSFVPENKKLEVVDTIRADKDVYVGWHFSPTHRVTLEENGFRFGDGTDEIVVQITGLDGTELEVTRRDGWIHDGYTLPLDWHESVGGPKRIAENIGYTPVKHQREFKVRVVIQANPN